MKTNEISISANGTGMREAIEMTETLGEQGGLDRKSKLHLRLLSEELIGLLRGITGDVQATYWVEEDDKSYELHLKSEIMLTQEIHEQLLSVSSSGRNEATKGFMGKLRDMIMVSMLPSSTVSSALTGFSMGFGTMASPGAASVGADVYLWSLSMYRQEIEKNPEDQEIEDLQRSIVANIADEVKVSMKNPKVEVTIFKKF